LEAGFQDYITKPIDVPILLSKIGQYFKWSFHFTNRAVRDGRRICGYSGACFVWKSVACWNL